MELDTYLANQAEISYRTKAGLTLFTFSNLRKLLEHCRKNKMIILGIEGFWVTNQSICPDMQAIADFSQTEYLPQESRSTKTVYLAQQFLENLTAQQKKELLFEITIAI
ncbi:MAG TPA: hypothetical protein PKC68_06920 [Alphaproteobacteria bacterium]|jgi:hypothetical protein|nr:hypothetical protein [Alphaproteobacteria bacterium]